MEGTPERAELLKWLLDSDPSIRWQVKKDLMNVPDADVEHERSLVAMKGWGTRLLGLQQEDGNWGGGPWAYQSWASTMETLMLLRELGVDPLANAVRAAIKRVRNGSNWGEYHGHSPFFSGESEPCINGRVLACGAYFGEPNDQLAELLLGEQLDDGGWNCDAPPSTRSSFNTTICVLEGLLEYERALGTNVDVHEARMRGQEYLLERRLFRKLSTQEVIRQDRKSGCDWTMFAFPTYWHYDILWGLEYLRKAEVRQDDRLAEAIELVVSKRDRNGRWVLDLKHEGRTHFEMEKHIGAPSRWLTLRATRVLRWFNACYHSPMESSVRSVSSEGFI